MTETGENWKIALDFKKPNSYHLISSGQAKMDTKLSNFFDDDFSFKIIWIFIPQC